MKPKASAAAIALIVNLRKEGFALDFSRQGQTPCGLDICEADDGFSSWVVYADGTMLGRGVDFDEYCEGSEQYERWQDEVAHEYARAIGAA